MLEINRLKYKNLLSVGNDGISIEMDRHHNTLFMGANGTGKSTNLSALYFGLYGKDFRGIKKAGIVNSINKKNLLVEVDFKVDGTPHRVVRGIKPDIFEVYKEGNLLNQEAKKVDQQADFEKNILKFPASSFKQIVIAGSGEYVQFMKLSTPARREFSENFLEIDIFTKMKFVLKDKISELNTEIKDVEYVIKNLCDKESYIQSQLEQKRKNSTQKVSEYQALNEEDQSYIDAFLKKRGKAVDEISAMQSKIDAMQPAEKVLSNLNVTQCSHNSKISSIQKSLRDFNSIECCPTCFQKVDEAHRDHIAESYQTESAALESDISSIAVKIAKIEKALEKKDSYLKTISAYQAAISKIDSDVSAKNSSIGMRNKLISEAADISSDDMLKLKEIEEEKCKNTNILGILKDKLATHNFATLLLKDDGIKSVIIKKYVNIINSLINGYLNKFNFYVNFEFDENFNETIKSRHRDVFTYENFSEGEKARIDLSILFAFRSLAKMKNSLDCNLLILDETIDSAVDANGVDDLRSIFETFPDLNIFVVSHRERAAELFDKVFEFKKIQNFTRMIEIQ